MPLHRDIFNFSAKVSCLEGYLYEREEADTSTLPNWVGNMEKMYRNLPEEVKRDLAKIINIFWKKPFNLLKRS